MTLKHHLPLRSNMEKCLEHAANGRSEVGLTRNEIIRNKNAAEKRAEFFAKFRERLAGKPAGRVANVRKVNGGFHVIGMGVLPVTMNELRVKLGVNSYKAFRMGGLVFNVNK